MTESCLERIRELPHEGMTQTNMGIKAKGEVYRDLDQALVM